MKLSQFTVVVKDYPTTDHYLLYHTLSQGLVKVDKAGWNMLQNLSKTTPTDAQALASLKALQARGFIVEESINEGERYLQYLNQGTSEPGGELNVTLLTNLQRCPLACSYCYQKGTHTGGQLAGDLSEECLEFIKGHCLKLGVERLFISYYGSEPLSNPKAILSTATELKQFCQKHGIQFRFGLVTNGVLLTRKMVQKLLPLGFVQAQITIDGNQQTHDASRPFQSGKGTYSTIMENLSQYVGLIHTSVLCVLDESRINAAYELIDTLARKGYAQQQVRMTFSPVMPTNDNGTIEAAQSSLDAAQVMIEEKKIAVEVAKLSIYAAKKGLYDDLRPQHTWCAMQRHDGRNITLDPSGKIYTCPTFIGRDEKYEAGHISGEVGGIDLVLKEQYTRSEKCLSCRYLPVCADCRADALHQTGEITEANPKEEVYDSIVPLLVKAHYQTVNTARKDRQTPSTV